MWKDRALKQAVHLAGANIHILEADWHAITGQQVSSHCRKNAVKSHAGFGPAAIADAPCAAAQAVLTKEHCIIYRHCPPTECFKGCSLGVFE